MSLNFEELCNTGFWFCPACQKISTAIDVDRPSRCPQCGIYRLKWCPPVPKLDAAGLERLEVYWRRSAARDRSRMRLCATMWRETPSPHLLESAIAQRNAWHLASGQADHYAQMRKERAA